MACNYTGFGGARAKVEMEVEEEVEMEAEAGRIISVPSSLRFHV